MSGSFTFMHAADLHLDSPFRGLAGVPAVVRDRLRESTFEAFAAIVDIARRERLDFIVIAGDLYDKADRSLRAQLRMQQALSKLAEDNIQVFIVHGNHDPADGWQAELEWPNTVHVFRSEQPEWKPAYTREGELAAHVYGMSYASASVKDNLAALYRRQEGAPFHLALLHANVDGQANYDNYAPCKLSELRSASFDYWALGHIHDRRVLSEYPHVVYPGNIQGRSVKETGSRGVYVVRVCEEGRIEMSYRDVASVIWEEIAVSIEGAEREQDLKHRLLDAVESVRSSSGGRPVVLRLRLEGAGVLHERLMDEQAGEVWLEELREWIGSPDDEEHWVWLDRLDIRTRLSQENELSPNEGFLGVLHQRAQAALADKERSKSMIAEATETMRRHPRLREWLDSRKESEQADLIRRAADYAELLLRERSD